MQRDGDLDAARLQRLDQIFELRLRRRHLDRLGLAAAVVDFLEFRAQRGPAERVPSQRQMKAPRRDERSVLFGQVVAPDRRVGIDADPMFAWAGHELELRGRQRTQRDARRDEAKGRHLAAAALSIEVCVCGCPYCLHPPAPVLGRATPRSALGRSAKRRRPAPPRCLRVRPRTSGAAVRPLTIRKSPGSPPEYRAGLHDRERAARSQHHKSSPEKESLRVVDVQR
mmetsp:Transcript_27661/g.85492  ORF Transcript_27661/g.85492 Transcript_27661/m.85492 type:complete len:226 (-) Transcript_27661:1232-1909(-)